jgi:hypothetical protein
MLMTNRKTRPRARARANNWDRRKMRDDRLDRSARRELSARALEATAFLVELRAEGEMEMERQEENEYQSQRAHQPAGLWCRAQT